MNSYGDGNTYRGMVCKDSETPTIITDGKTAYSGKDYPVHSSGPWSVSAGIAPDKKGRLIVEDCSHDATEFRLCKLVDPKLQEAPK